jgi:hypothetical protein
MDQQRFDRVTRRFAQAPSRRKLIGMLATSVVAAVLPGRKGIAQEWTCPPGLVYCDGVGCVDVSSDNDNCGACYAVCESDLVAVGCVSGQCVQTTCGPYLTYCGVLGGCANLQFDPYNCGGCGNVCDSGICNDGVCQAGPGYCAPGLVYCDDVGCVDTSSDLDHCGACFQPCESGLVAVACQDGQCVRNTCGPDRTYCGVIGGCRDLSSDSSSCGACGNVCPSGTTCWFGTCL